jgi:hypothetical protein
MDIETKVIFTRTVNSISLDIEKAALDLLENSCSPSEIPNARKDTLIVTEAVDIAKCDNSLVGES